MNLRRSCYFATVLVASISALNVAAEQLKVKGVITQWQPLVLFAQPGDTVTFVNMIGHDTEAGSAGAPPGLRGRTAKQVSEPPLAVRRVGSRTLRSGAFGTGIACRDLFQGAAKVEFHGLPTGPHRWGAEISSSSCLM